MGKTSTIYDTILTIRSIPSVDTSIGNKLLAHLKEGLTDRVSSIEICSSSVTDGKTSTYLIGLQYNKLNFGRILDRGPSAMDEKAKQKFRTFWGEKSQLRKFKDLTLCEALLWDSEFEHENLSAVSLKKMTGLCDKTSKYAIIPRMIVYIVERHLKTVFGTWPFQDHILFSNLYLNNFISLSQDKTGDSLSSQSELNEMLRQIPNPLMIKNILPLTTDISLNEHKRLPCPVEVFRSSKRNKDDDKLTIVPTVMNYLIQVEFSSSWPSQNHPRAIYAMMAAYLLHLSKELRRSVKVPVQEGDKDETIWTSICSDLLETEELGEEGKETPPLSYWPPFMDIWYKGLMYRYWIDTIDFFPVPFLSGKDIFILPWTKESEIVQYQKKHIETETQLKDSYYIWDFRRSNQHRLFIHEVQMSYFDCWKELLRLINFWANQHFLIDSRQELAFEHLEVLLYDALTKIDLSKHRCSSSPALFQVFLLYLSQNCNNQMNYSKAENFILLKPLEIDGDSSQKTIPSTKDIDSIYFGYPWRGLEYSISKSLLRRVSILAGASLAVLSEDKEFDGNFSKYYSIFKHDCKASFHALFSCDVGRILAGMRRTAAIDLTESMEQASFTAKPDFLGLMLLPGFNPYQYCLLEIRRQYPNIFIATSYNHEKRSFTVGIKFSVETSTSTATSSESIQSTCMEIQNTIGHGILTDFILL